ncbi:MAG: GxxExxY protein [Planctomycetia bacterium]|nr:GxxExxY protein [Planctomycetia bacterium]
MAHILFKELSYNIIGCAMEVQKQLGVGFLESVYEEALKIELQSNQIPFESQKKYPVLYKDNIIKDFYCDLVIDNKIIIELKAINNIGNIERAQVLNYLKVTGLKLGIILNFGETSLKYERIVL